MTDEELVRRFLDGEESAFNKLVNKYQQKIYWHARRLTGNHFDADDILQEVLMVMYSKLGSYKFESSLYTWIFKITYTRSLNLMNKNKLKRFFSLSDDDAPELSGNDDIVRDLENKEKLQILDKVLLSLPVKQREVFIMRHFDELSYEEISDITGKSVGGLKANYFHALNKVTSLMEKEYGKNEPDLRLLGRQVG
jgi:RNA polymerase sigma-70 factor (ECF subfamily)